ncbi:MAG: sulfate ABC transporter permease subunit CysT [Armatimonadetes bacterium]|nr:sulfate ABC transporter permease subunit CysT [Armatimonadota bacterium]
MSTRLRRPGVLPGFGLTMGFTLLYLGLVVLLPLGCLAARAMALDWAGFVRTVTDPRVVASYRLTFGAALAAAGINALFGFVVAWVLVRYRFPGRAAVDALVDLPFALPTAVSGIALTALYAPNGLLGSRLAALGIKSAFSPLGVVIALTFIGLPFVVRTLQPALEELDPELEEAAASLGAGRVAVVARVLVPPLLPALLTGFSLAFARALGEYGSVIFIAGNLPMKTEITSLLIITKLEQFDYAGATALAVVMLAAALGLLVVVNGLQAWAARRYRGGGL